MLGKLLIGWNNQKVRISKEELHLQLFDEKGKWFQLPKVCKTEGLNIKDLTEAESQQSFVFRRALRLRFVKTKTKVIWKANKNTGQQHYEPMRA